MLRILNASATMHRRIGFSGHTFEVAAMDGNPVAVRSKVRPLNWDRRRESTPSLK